MRCAAAGRGWSDRQRNGAIRDLMARPITPCGPYNGRKSLGVSVATAQEPQRVSAADFIRGFANWRLQSARKPVVVTHHGKDAHVLISLDDYRRLDGKTARDVATASDMLQASLAGLVESRPEEHTSELQSLMRIFYDVLC